MLNNLLPSAESFANLLSSLESQDRSQMSSGRNTVGSEQLDMSLSMQQRSQPAQLTVAAQTDGPSSLRHTATAKPLSASIEHVYVKEEQIDMSYEQKLVETPTTTSGRNRGRGKATEPKYECQICGDIAAGYHCGAYVCEACKVFSVILLCSRPPYE